MSEIINQNISIIVPISIMTLLIIFGAIGEWNYKRNWENE